MGTVVLLDCLMVNQDLKWCDGFLLPTFSHSHTHTLIVPFSLFPTGSPWTDPVTGLSVTLPGNGTFKTLGRDPYADFVSLAFDLGLSGVDVDYEEMWHADYFKAGSDAGPWTLDQTVKRELF